MLDWCLINGCLWDNEYLVNGCSSLVKEIHVIITVELISDLKCKHTGVSLCVFYVESDFCVCKCSVFLLLKERKKEKKNNNRGWKDHTKHAGSDFEGSGCTNG